jgi:opacity protein-like surface antigen
MNHTLIGKTVALLCTACVLAAAPAQADEDNWYGTANIGVGSLSSATLTYSDGTSSSSASGDYSASVAFGGTLGYNFANGFAVEGEIMYRRNDLDPVNLEGLGSFTEGDFASLAFAVNALYRFRLGDSGKLTGYVGPGVVYFQEIDIDFETNGQETSFEESDTGFQLKLGGRYDFSERWFAEAGATYLIADAVTMELPADPTQTIESDYDHWALSVGVGFRF